MAHTKKTTHRELGLSNYQAAIGLPNIVEKLSLIMILSTILIFTLWSKDGIGITASTMLVLFPLSTILFFISKSGRPKEAGVGLFFIVAISVTYLSAQGDGIYNVPNIFFPVILIFSGLLFGKKLIPYITFFITSLITLLFILDRIDIIIPFDGVILWAPDYFALLVTILIITAVILSLVIKTIEKSIETIALSEKLIKESYELTLEGWAKALELSHREPEGHSKRVVTLVTEFADNLGLDKEAKESLRQGALLHDIGKMGVPDSILLKPGPLNEKELEVSKEHTLFAKKILKEITDFESIMDIPVYHHEQWDGQGYPEGLKAENIPYLARIFAVIDNWDSLNRDQAYRAAWKKEKTISYLAEQSGKKFDKKIVDAFLNFVKQQSGEIK